MIAEPTDPLSPMGVARRDAMLPDLIDAMQRLHCRRRRRKRIAAISTLTGMAVICALSVRLAQIAPPMAPAPHAANPVHAPVGSIITVVQTDRSTLDRHRPATSFSAILIDDQSLLDVLAEIDRPAGLIRMDGQVRLTAVPTDPPNHDARDRL